MRRFECLVAAAVIATLTSCSGASGPEPLPPAQTPASASSGAREGAGSVRLQIRIPKRRHRRPHARAKYISSATRSIAITITSISTGSSKTYNQDLTPSSPGCNPASMVCTIPITLKSGGYSAAFATFDGLLDANHNPMGNELSANQSVDFTIHQGKLNILNVTLEGVPASVVMYPATSSTLSGNASSGYSLDRCGQASQTVSIYGVDADGNLILGTGAPVASLSSDNASSLAVSTPSPSAPNRFVLKPPARPAFAFPGTVVHLTASVQPGTGSGASPKSLAIDVTYSAAICGVFTEFSTPTAMSAPEGITVGPDGAIWFTENAVNRIGRIPTSATASNPGISEYPIPTLMSHPFAISASADALWFTECGVSQIGRISTDGSLVLEFPIPTAASAPQGLTAGPDGAQWFTESKGNNIGRIQTNGVISITEFAIPTTQSVPFST